jgi:hypothetical protein
LNLLPDRCGFLNKHFWALPQVGRF